jgi:hypothetical protein
MSCQNTAEWASGNIFIRPVRLQTEGDQIHGHTHNFDHTTIILRGSVRIETNDGRSQVFHAPAHCLIKKDVRHEITALSDGVEFWCVYAHRTRQGEIVQESTGWLEAYA